MLDEICLWTGRAVWAILALALAHSILWSVKEHCRRKRGWPK